jgi:N6-adenosine-specific RNA methylase IME4
MFPIMCIKCVLDAIAWGFKEQVSQTKWFKSNQQKTFNQHGTGSYLSTKLEAIDL